MDVFNNVIEDENNFIVIAGVYILFFNAEGQKCGCVRTYTQRYFQHFL